MSAKMQVLASKQTGHVLAAFTRTTDPEGKPKVSDLTGGGLRVRGASSTPGGAIVLQVPPDSLEVVIVDFDADIFGNPVGFVAGGGVVTSGAGNKTLALLTTATDFVTFTTGIATFNLKPPIPKTKFWVQLEEALPSAGQEPQRRLLTGEIPENTTVSTMPVNSPLMLGNHAVELPPPARDYFLLLLVEGFQPLFDVKQL